MKLRSYIYVIIQFTSLFLIVFLSEYKNITSWYFIFSWLGLILALWAMWVMRKSSFTVMPDPGNYFKLITKGPYHLIRHPMYTSLFLFIVPFVINNFNYRNLTIFFVFTVNQVLKLLFEENIIADKFPEYEDYKKKTWRLIPLIY